MNGESDKMIEAVARAAMLPAATFLGVDDDAVFLKFLGDLCESEKVKFVGVASGEDAVRLFMECCAQTPRYYPFALVFLDLRLNHGMGGGEVLARIKDLRADQPVMIVSGFIEKEKLGAAAKVGYVAFAEKPFGVTPALQAIRLHTAAWRQQVRENIK